MLSRAFLVLAALPAALLFTTEVRAQEARVSVRSRSVYLGDPFEYRLTLVDAPGAKIGEFAPKDFNVELSSTPTLSTMSFNGRRTQSEIHSYAMTAKKAGRFTIKPPIVLLNGEQLEPQEVEVEVVGPEESPLFNLDLKVDPPSVYPLQRFAVRLDVNLRELPAPFRVMSPVSRVRPRLMVPWLQADSVPDGLQPGPFDFNNILRSGGGGFTVNGLTNRVLFEPREYVFLPPEEKVQTKDEETGKETTWFRYRFERSFTALKPGVYSLGRSSLRGELIDKIEDARASTTSVFGVTEPLTVDVKPLPLDTRPDSWCGVIGELDVKSTITPTSARVGEPLTLTLQLSGSGLLADAFPPDLGETAAITEKFKVYDATSRPTNSGRIFTYSLRAKEPGDIEFPSIELAWFNPNLEKYVTGKTSPIPLSITKSQVLSTDAIVGAPQEVPTALQATTGGLAANAVTLQVVRFQAKPWFVAWAGIGVFTALAWIVSGRTASAKQKARTKQKQRLALANAKVTESLKQLSANQVGDGITAIREAVNSIVAAVSDSADGGLTSEEAVSRLSASGIDQPTIARTSELLKTLDAARYGGLSESTEDLQSRVKSVIGDLIKSANRVRS
ncbi:MAG: BatD family protein [Planctomycetaceae bacterium]